MSETSTKSLFPSYRVFIFGQEVTDDVVSVTIEESDGRYPNTCAVTLLSKYDRYIITPYDMLSLGLVGTAQTKAVQGNIPVLDPIQANMSPAERSNVPVYGSLLPMNDAVKSAVVNAKRHVPPTIFTPDATPAVPVPKPQIAYRYPFQAGKPIFHPNDPVRVFFRDPGDPSTWYHQFSGLISDFTEEADADNNNTVTIVAETAAKWLRYGRFTSNPGLVDIKQQVVQTAIVQDINVRSVFANLFNQLTLPEIFFAMLFGVSAFEDNGTFTAQMIQGSSFQLDFSPSTNTSALNGHVETIYDRAYSVSAPNGVALARRKWGIGHLNLSGSKIFIFGDNTDVDSGNDGIPKGIDTFDIDTLAEYHAELDHTVKGSDLSTMRADGKDTYPTQFISTSSDTSVDEVIGYIGAHPEIYPTDSGRLMMLLPRQVGSARRSVVINDIVSSFNLNTEWATRGEVLADVVERIQFVFYVSPRGDFCVEFPLYDFMPENFDHPDDDDKKFGANYLVGVDDTTNVSSSFTDSKVMTQATCASTVAYNYEKSVSGNATVLKEAGLLQVVTLWHMIPLYGVRQMPLQPRGYINTDESAKLFAAIALNRANADSYTQRVNMNPRFTGWLNRPYYVQRRNHIGTTRTISHNITWGMGGDASTTLGLGTMRGWDGTVDVNGKMIFTPIGMRALQYNTLFQQRGAQQPNQSSKTPVKAEGQ